MDRHENRKSHTEFSGGAIQKVLLVPLIALKKFNMRRIKDFIHNTQDNF